MLKKSGVIVLTMLYLLTGIGFALNLHYCFNSITSVEVDAPAKSCNNNPMAAMKCCKDTRIDIKIKDAHQSQASTFLIKIFSFELGRLPFVNIYNAGQTILARNYFDNAPPDPPDNHPRVFIKNCTFRI